MVQTIYIVRLFDDMLDDTLYIGYRKTREEAKQLAKDLSYVYDTISIRINDDREMAIGCSTIIPDATSLMAVIPYMLEVVGKALEVFLTSYEKSISQQKGSCAP